MRVISLMKIDHSSELSEWQDLYIMDGKTKGRWREIFAGPMESM